MKNDLEVSLPCFVASLGDGGKGGIAVISGDNGASPISVLIEVPGDRANDVDFSEPRTERAVTGRIVDPLNVDPVDDKGEIGVRGLRSLGPFDGEDVLGLSLKFDCPRLSVGAREDFLVILPEYKECCVMRRKAQNQKRMCLIGAGSNAR